MLAINDGYDASILMFLFAAYVVWGLFACFADVGTGYFYAGTILALIFLAAFLLN